MYMHVKQCECMAENWFFWDDKIIVYVFHTYGGFFSAKELYIFGGVKLDDSKKRTRVK